MRYFRRSGTKELYSATGNDKEVIKELEKVASNSYGTVKFKEKYFSEMQDTQCFTFHTLPPFETVYIRFEELVLLDIP